MMHSITKNKILRKILSVALIALFWLFIWQLIYKAVNKEILLVSPITVLKRLYELVPTESFWKTILSTLLRIVVGFLSGTLIGILMGMTTSKIKILNAMFKPIMGIIKATPVASFIILLLVWSKNIYIPSIISFLMVLPIVWSNVYKGIEQTDKNLLQMAQVFNLGRYKTIKNIYIPSVMPYFISAAITALGLSWKAGVAAEVLCTPANSVGSMLNDAKIYLETPDLFAWTLTVIIISMILEAFLVYLLKRYDKRRKRGIANASTK